MTSIAQTRVPSRCASLFRLALGAALLMTGLSALASTQPTPPPPPPPDCSNGSASSNSGCPSTSNSGVTQSSVANTSIFLSNAVSGSAGGFGNSLTGGTSTAPGVARYALGDTGRAGAGAGARWNVWTALAQSRIGYDFSPLQSGGHVDVGIVGVDYTFGSSVILGLAVSAERTRVGTSFNGGSLNGRGNTVAPYLAWAITRAWILDASLGYGRTSLDTTDNSVAGGITGSTRDIRDFGSLGLSYNHLIGRWQLTGKGQVLTAHDQLGQFTLSNGNFVPGTSSRTTQGRLGGQAAYNMGNGVTPYLGLTYIYDLQRPNQAPVGGQNAANDRDGVQLLAGINFQSKGPVYGGITLMSEQGRRQIKNDQVLLNLGFRF